MKTARLRAGGCPSTSNHPTVAVRLRSPNWYERNADSVAELPDGGEVPMDRAYHEEIRQRAHQLWEKAGKPEGKEDHFWLEAERQLNQERIQHELKTPDNL
jgi:hypothetical protein